MVLWTKGKLGITVNLYTLYLMIVFAGPSDKICIDANEKTMKRLAYKWYLKQREGSEQVEGEITININ